MRKEGQKVCSQWHTHNPMRAVDIWSKGPVVVAKPKAPNLPSIFLERSGRTRLGKLQEMLMLNDRPLVLQRSETRLKSVQALLHEEKGVFTGPYSQQLDGGWPTWAHATQRSGFDVYELWSCGAHQREHSSNATPTARTAKGNQVIGASSNMVCTTHSAKQRKGILVYKGHHKHTDVQ